MTAERCDKQGWWLKGAKWAVILSLSWLPLAGLTESDPPPARLVLPSEPAPANQAFEALFHFYTFVGTLNTINLESISGTELVFAAPHGCGFLCPGAKEYAAFPFEMPPLSPGNYTVTFIRDPDRPPVAEFDMAVGLGVSAQQPVAIFPAEPQAYTPFRIEALTMGSNLPPDRRPVSVSVEDDVIRVEYLIESFGVTVPQDSFVSEVQGLPPGDYTVEVSVRDAEGVTEKEYEWQFSIAPLPAAQPAFTFFHPAINHYFVTADEEERDLVLADGWYSVDEGFNVWPADGPAPDAALPVCRFYSSSVNSHFYTASQEECEHLRSPHHYSGWLYEGIAFRALAPVANACPSGTAPVWRLYNDRYDWLDSNHRFVTSQETYRTMINEGWIGEGVAFCSPQLSRAEE